MPLEQRHYRTGSGALKSLRKNQAFQGVAFSLMLLLVVVLLLQEIRTGNRLVDVVVFQVGCRVVALGLVIGWVARSARRTERGKLARGLGGGLLMFAFLTGFRFVFVLTSHSYDKVFHGVNLMSWFGISLLVGCHVALVIAGVLLLLYARRNISENKRPGATE